MNIPVKIREKSNILLAGAGGGFDFLCALPVALLLLEEGHTVHVASYSFTALKKVKNARCLTDNIIEITEKSTLEGSEYFPEFFLSQWFKEKKGISMPVYCFPTTGIKSLRKAYIFLKESLHLDCVFIVDGGVDGIFRGDEFALGTPSMDAISIIAASLSDFQNSYYAMTAFGTEGVNKEVSHADVLERISELIKKDKFYGLSALLKHTRIGREFIDGATYIFDRMKPEYRSTIVSSILKAMDGNFGDMAVNEKTAERPVWVSPLTLLYWFFDLEAVAKMKLYYSESLNTDSVFDVVEIIEKTRSSETHRIRKSIPI